MFARNLVLSLVSVLALSTTASFVQKGNLAIVNGTYSVEWLVNETAITFTVKASIGNGWFLLGWMRQASVSLSKLTNLSQTRGDVLAFWQKDSSVTVVLDCNTIRKKGGLQKDKDMNDFTVLQLKKAPHKPVVLKVVRKLDTGNDEEDVVIKPEPMWLFGAHGVTANYTQHLKDIKIDDIDDSLVFVPMTFMQDLKAIVRPTQNATESNKTGFREFVAHLARQHWIAIVIGSSSVLTLFIAVILYCCCKKKSGPRKSGPKKKKVKVSFFREENDSDMEAREAFLQSTT